MKPLTLMYFSPTGTSEKITKAIAQGLSPSGAQTADMIDLTKPENRIRNFEFSQKDRLVLGYPVYGGRVPAILQGVFQKIKGHNTPIILAAVYGNRAYEDALIEAHDLFSQNGFLPVGAGAFIGEHSYSEKVAKGRPDAEDVQKAKEFGQRISEKLSIGDTEPVTVSGNRPYKDPMPDMPFRPKTKETCTNCGICAAKCPMEVISKTDPKVTAPGCILCSACIKGCPEQAKYLDAEPILKVKAMLESKCLDRKEPELFL